MKLSICTDSVFSGMPTEQAMEIVHSWGFDTVEFWGWWDKDVKAIAQKRQELGLHIAGICTRFANLTDPACHAAYVEGLKETLAVAQTLHCTNIISQVGNDTGRPRAEQRQSIIEGLKACVPLLEAAGCTLLVEPLNTRVDHISYYLWSSDEAAEILTEVDSPAVKMLFDCYHQQIMEGDVTRRVCGLVDKIGHIHVAGNPGRHEPECGELRYESVLAALSDAGYTGHVGFEFFPKGDAQASLQYWNSQPFWK